MLLPIQALAEWLFRAVTVLGTRMLAPRSVRRPAIAKIALASHFGTGRRLLRVTVTTGPRTAVGMSVSLLAMPPFAPAFRAVRGAARALPAIAAVALPGMFRPALGLRRCRRRNQCCIATPVSRRDRLPNEALDFLEVGALFPVAERNCDALVASPRRAADPMDVALGDVRKFEIDHMGDEIDVDAARCNVGGDERSNAGRLERGKCGFALSLALIAVNGGSGNSCVLEVLCNLVGATLRAREYQRPLHGVIAEEFDKKRPLLRRLDENDLLRNAIGRLGNRRYGNPRRVLEKLRGEGSDLVRHGGREKEALPARGKLGNELAKRPDEPEVEHLIGLVEDEDFRGIECDVLPFHMVDQAAWRGDENINSALKGVDLRTVAHATVHNRNFQAEMTSVGAEAFTNLIGELPGRREDQRPRAAARRRAAVRIELMKNGKSESGRLSGSGLCNPEQVAPLEDERNGLRLNGSRLGVSFRLERLQEQGIEVKVLKVRQMKVFPVRPSAHEGSPEYPSASRQCWHGSVA